MITYRDLISIKVNDNGDRIVPLEKDKILFGYMPELSDMKVILGDTIFVREGTYDKLLKAQHSLKTKNPNLSLYVTYGYRSLKIQTERFMLRLKECANIYFQNPEDLYEEVHRSIAVPSVAGHPTGGAVDIKIIDIPSGKFLDFGSEQYNYSNKKYYVYSPNVKGKAMSNRMLLRECMVGAGFAPFDGEWWHFSYGDREWACFYKKHTALYDQIKVSELDKFK